MIQVDQDPIVSLWFDPQDRIEQEAFMHAVVVTVNIAPGQIEASQKALREQVIPRVSKTPGFVKGYWTAGSDPQHGMSVVLFASKQDADNAMNMIRSSPMPPMVTLNSIEVREVIAEA